MYGFYHSIPFVQYVVNITPHIVQCAHGPNLNDPDTAYRIIFTSPYLTGTSFKWNKYFKAHLCCLKHIPHMVAIRRNIGRELIFLFLATEARLVCCWHSRSPCRIRVSSSWKSTPSENKSIGWSSRHHLLCPAVGALYAPIGVLGQQKVDHFVYMYSRRVWRTANVRNSLSFPPIVLWRGPRSGLTKCGL